MCSKSSKNHNNLEIFGSQNRPKSSPKTNKDKPDTTSEKQHKKKEKQALATNFLVKSELKKTWFCIVFSYTILTFDTSKKRQDLDSTLGRLGPSWDAFLVDFG